MFDSIQVGNKKALIDVEDYEDISKYSWHIVSDGYAEARGGNNRITMHRHLTKAAPGEIVDHINGNRLDNRKANLRIVDIHQSNKNRSGKSKSTSKYKGVSWDSRTKSWAVSINADKKTRFGGRHKNEKVAARVYNELAKKFHGEFARLNRV